jgi:2-haloacid dehalogenase
VGQRPRTIVFDVVETLFSLEPLIHRLDDLGLQGELWVARLMRDGFALEVAGLWRSFRDLAAAQLTIMAEERGLSLDDATRDGILSSLAEMPPYDDVRVALETARAAGVSCVCLTNGAADTTQQLFQRAGLEPLRIVSADELQHWKPLWDVYLHAADVLGQDPHELAMVSAHDWDIEGARQASYTTAWVSRRGAGFSPLLAPPDIRAANLSEAIQQLVALPSGQPQRPPTETLH